MNTQLEIAQSPEVLQRVITKLNLDKNPRFDPRQAKSGWWEKLTSLFGDSRSDAAQMTDTQVRQAIEETLKANMRARLLEQSYIVEIRYSSTSPQMAALISEALANSLIENDLNSKFEMTQQATNWMNERLVELRTALNDSEKSCSNSATARAWWIPVAW
ncbi:MAG: hypothetical protein HC848_03560 [Limnobacter sp.]|nr:hypothetical protein [Limnobacter sp.]